jgi:Domain of unknown function (DUF1844)
MSEQEEQAKGFKVTDRRSFTREGERIQTSDEEQNDHSVPDVSAAPEFLGEASSASKASKASKGSERLEAERRYQAAGQMDLHFMDLLSLLATQASFALGAPHPATGESHEDPESARLMISMLEVLKDKTKGNLARDEEAALDEILYQLRMEFMVKARVTKS